MKDTEAASKTCVGSKTICQPHFILLLALALSPAALWLRAGQAAEKQ